MLIGMALCLHRVHQIGCLTTVLVRMGSLVCLLAIWVCHRLVATSKFEMVNHNS
jgi:hypothetical protein